MQAANQRIHPRACCSRPVPFREDEWVGGVLSFGEGDDAPAIAVTMRDVRCSIVNLDPDSASRAPEVLKAVVGANQNNAAPKAMQMIGSESGRRRRASGSQATSAINTPAPIMARI